MLRRILQNIFRPLFKEELQEAEERVQQKLKFIEDNKYAILMRSIFAKFDEHYLNDVVFSTVEELPNVEHEAEADDEKDVFFSGIHDLVKNTALERILNYMMRSQMVFIARESPSFERSNFARATISALQVFRDEIIRLDNIYVESRKPEEEFDEHGVT